MSGTKKGGLRAKATNKERYGDDFYAKIGSKGGKLGKTGGFAAGEEGKARARVYGRIGGAIGSRSKNVPKPVQKLRMQLREGLITYEQYMELVNKVKV